MKRYEGYKDSGVERIGEIPGTWGVWKLKFLTKKIGSGVTPLGGSEVYKPEGIAFFRSQNIYNDRFELGNISFIEEAIHLGMKGSMVLSGDVLLNITGASIGRCFYFSFEFPEANVNQHVCIIRANKNIYFRFLHSVMISKIGQNQILSMQSGSSREGLNFEQLKQFDIPLPPLPEQHSIVKFLDHKTDRIDRFIANRKKQIDLLKEQKAAIINKAVTKGIDPNAKMKDSGIEWIGEVPEHWGVSKVKFVANVKGRIGFRGYTVTDLVEAGEGSLTLGATHINKEGGIDLSKPVFISWDKYYESPEIMVEKDDILVVQRGSVGVVGIVDTEIGHATINPSLVVLKKVRMNKYLLFLQLRSKIVKEAIITIFNETAVPMLSQNQISNFNILLPPTQKEQKEIIEYIKSETSTIDTLITKYQKQIDLMKEYRTALISQAVTGKIKVV